MTPHTRTNIHTVLDLADLNCRTCAIAIILSLYLSKHNMPIPVWTRKKSCHVIRYPLHQVFAVSSSLLVQGLTSCLVSGNVSYAVFWGIF